MIHRAVTRRLNGQTSEKEITLEEDLRSFVTESVAKKNAQIVNL